jgi:hypothetical protein
MSFVFLFSIFLSSSSPLIHSPVEANAGPVAAPPPPAGAALPPTRRCRAPPADPPRLVRPVGAALLSSATRASSRLPRSRLVQPAPRHLQPSAAHLLAGPPRLLQLAGAAALLAWGSTDKSPRGARRSRVKPRFCGSVRAPSE